MKIKTSELEGVTLDYAVATAKYGCSGLEPFAYSTEWGYGGPIIQREGILFCLLNNGKLGATLDTGHYSVMQSAGRDQYLIAAMRCYVASRLGDEVEIPDELI